MLLKFLLSLYLCHSCLWAGEDDRLRRVYASADLSKKTLSPRGEKCTASKGAKAKKGLLVTTKDHEGFMQHSVKSAKKQIVIASPSINPKYFRDTFGPWVATANKNVQFTIYTKNKSYLRLIELIGESPTFHGHVLTLKTTNNSDTKLFIRDKKILALGSYNWLNKPKSANMTLINASLNAKSLIDSALNALEAAVSAEKDFSLQAAKIVKINELAEDSSFKSSKSQPNLDTDVKALTSREKTSD